MQSERGKKRGFPHMEKKHFLHLFCTLNSICQQLSSMGAAVDPVPEKCDMCNKEDKAYIEYEGKTLCNECYSKIKGNH
jgi:hypothetical protein